MGAARGPFAAPVSFQDLELLRSRAKTVSNLGTYMPMAVTLSGRGEAVHLSGVRISPQVLAMLEATPLMGRLLEPREEASGLDRVAVISYSMWRRRLGGDDAILGKTIVLDGIQYEVVGVMRPGFQFPNADAEFWVPFGWRPRAQPVVVGRINAGASFLTASKEVDDLDAARAGGASIRRRADANRVSRFSGGAATSGPSRTTWASTFARIRWPAASAGSRWRPAPSTWTA